MRAISDEAVKALINSGICTDTDADREYVCECIDNIPTIEPKRGEWIKRTHNTLIAQVNFAYCSECGQPIMHEHTRPLWSFCPNCGAKMKGADDE